MAGQYKTTLQTPRDWILEYAVISQDGLQGSIDITKIVTDIEIFEHLDKSYLTGSIAIVDSNNVFNVGGFGGGETLEISIKLPPQQSGVFEDFQSVTRKFVIDKITSNTKTNDNTAVMVLHLIDYHSFVSHATNVNAAYTGMSTDVIAKILTDNLSMELDRPLLQESQQPMRVVIPNWTALKAAKWVRNRAVSLDGTPYYLYATLFDKKIKYRSLAEILTANAINPGRSYWYSQAIAQSSATMSVEQQSYNIESYGDKGNTSLLDLLDEGYVGATHYFIDPTVGLPIQADVNIDTAFQQLAASGILKQGQRDFIYKNTYRVNDTPLHQQAGRVKSHIALTNLFSDGYVGHSEAADIQTYRLFVLREAFRRFLTASSTDLVIPGYSFLKGGQNGASIGKNINVTFLKNSMGSDGQSLINLMDKKRSGEFLIYATRHIFKIDNGYTTIMSCVKLADMEVAQSEVDTGGGAG